MQQSFTTDYSTTFCKAIIYVMCAPTNWNDNSHFDYWFGFLCTLS